MYTGCIHILRHLIREISIQHFWCLGYLVLEPIPMDTKGELYLREISFPVLCHIGIGPLFFYYYYLVGTYVLSIGGYGMGAKCIRYSFKLVCFYV